MDVLTLVLGAISILIPTLAVVLLLAIDLGISERHHSHHDTYLVAHSLIVTLVFSMVFMGALGLLLGWLCMVGAFSARATTVFAFFDSFLVTTFICWLLIRRYRVVTYEDRLEVVPFVGRKVTIPYQTISLMVWVPSMSVRNGRNVRVFVGYRRRAVLWAGIDVEQILIRIDRFDILVDNAGSV
jgi:hypothetical protein